MDVDSLTGAARRGEEWFVVLPDCDAALAVVAALDPDARCRRLRHPSGRPWLLGHWDPRDLVLGAAGRVVVALLGCCPVSAEEVVGIARRTRAPADLDRAAGRLHGAFHLLATVDGVVRAQGSAFGVRRLFQVRVGEVDVVSDRADVAAGLVGSGVDERWLVRCLMFPAAPPALVGASLWRGVTAVPEDCCVLLTDRGRARTVRWWEPPRPVRTLREGAPAVRDALTAAVSARVRSRDVVSADLSGGADSTAVCALAVARTGRLLTFTVASQDAGDDDAEWAAIAAAELPGLERLVLTDDDLPRPYADILEAGVPRDEPPVDVHLRAEDAVRARLLTGRGVELHLTGDGGDEVLHAAPSYLRELLPRRPLTAWSHVRGLRALRAWRWSRVWRLLAAPRDERRELLAQARGLTAPAARAPYAVGLPPWATPHAVDLARRLLVEAAERVPPTTPDKAVHDVVQLVRHAGRYVRRNVMAAVADGLPVAAPFLDDRVAEACLAVRAHERTTPWRYKPLLAEALRGVVPDRSSTRATKGGTTPEYAALPHYRADLLALTTRGRLAELGLIDVDRFRSALTGVWSTDATPIMVEHTVACERWLRDLDHAGRTAGLVRGAPG
uniref:asparagine synthase-related protein n=1 Tax=Saccharothrix mutabilis TaxID=33921 RepID=UPI0031D3A627